MEKGSGDLGRLSETFGALSEREFERKSGLLESRHRQSKESGNGKDLSEGLLRLGEIRFGITAKKIEMKKWEILAAPRATEACQVRSASSGILFALSHGLFCWE